jgi:hypothetical protein
VAVVPNYVLINGQLVQSGSYDTNILPLIETVSSGSVVSSVEVATGTIGFAEPEDIGDYIGGGGTLDIELGGATLGTVNSGTENVLFGGVVVGTLNYGQENVYAVAFGTWVYEGTQDVEPGGTAVGTTATALDNQAGSLVIENGGSATAAYVTNGASEFI